jgi:hypothetical protein
MACSNPENQFLTIEEENAALKMKQVELEGRIRYLSDQLANLSTRLRVQRGDIQPPPSSRSSPMVSSEESDDQSDHSHHSRPRTRYPTFNTNDFKVDIPEYDGRLDPDAFLEWLQTVERVFDYKTVPDSKKVKLVALKFRKYASTWWSNVCTKRERMGKDKIRNWAKMKKLMKEKFLPTYYLQENFSQLHNLKQGSKNVEEYARDFEYYMLKCDIREDEHQTLVRFVGGLNSYIANACELHMPSTFEELRLMAYRIEKQLKGKGRLETSRPTHVVMY